jgi:hypothetical protein
MRRISLLLHGNPDAAQAWANSPFGSAQGTALQRAGTYGVENLGVILPPSGQAGHWAGGWVSG